MLHSLNLCACGCGQTIKHEGNRFLNGHWARTPEGKAAARITIKIARTSPKWKPNLKKWLDSPEGKAQQKAGLEAAWASPNLRKWLASPEGKAHSQKNLEKMQIWSNSPEGKAHARAMGEKWASSPEGKAQFEAMSKKWINSTEGKTKALAQIKEAGERWHNSPEGKAQIRALAKKWNDSLEGKAQFRTMVYKWVNSPEGKTQLRENVKKAMAAQHNHPSNLEQRAFAIFTHYGLPFDFVGDLRSNSIGGKFPDFIDMEARVVIEVANKREKEVRFNIDQKKSNQPPFSPAGLYWQTYEQGRKAHYLKFGYTCVVLWENMSDEEMVAASKEPLHHDGKDLYRSNS